MLFAMRSQLSFAKAWFWVLPLLAVTLLASGDQDRLEIQAVLDSQVAAWNRGDLEGFMRGYWNSPQLSFFSGNSMISGWQATLERYRKRYQADGKEMGKLEFREIRIELLSSDAAFVRGRFALDFTSGEKPTGVFTLIVHRFPEGWRVVHDHTSS